MLHVNGDDPEAVVLVTQIALDYRNTFKRDVVIELALLPSSRSQRSGRAE